MTSRRNILGLLSLTTLLPFIAKATEEPSSPTGPIQQRSKEFEQWKNQVHYPVSESNDATVCRLLESSQSNQTIAIYYYGGSSPRQLRLASIESVFRIDNTPHTYVSAYCHLRRENRIFRVDKISLA
jgi:predicted DNA-binding transcriptional regulator YafY